MADNYLERKFEEHYASKVSAAKKRPTLAKSCIKPGELLVKFPERTVLVISDNANNCSAAVNAFRKANCRVAFCASIHSNGNSLAQSSGARFYPVDNIDVETLSAIADDIIDRWKQIEIIVFNDIYGNLTNVEAIIDLFQTRCRNNDFMRIQLLCDNTLNTQAIVAKFNSLNINCVMFNDGSFEQSQNQLGSLLLYLASPDAEIITHQIITV